MKKILVIAAAAAFAFCACTKDDTNKVQGSGDGKDDKASAGLVLNELSGADKYIELYNTTDKEINLDGCYLVKYDKSKDGGKSTTWTGKGGIKIAAKGYVVLESTDLADEAEGGDPNYEYESENHKFKVASQVRRTYSSSSTLQMILNLTSSSVVRKVLAGTRFQALITTRSTHSHVYLTEQVLSYMLILPRVRQTVQRLLTLRLLLKCNSSI